MLAKLLPDHVIALPPAAQSTHPCKTFRHLLQEWGCWRHPPGVLPIALELRSVWIHKYVSYSTLRAVSRCDTLDAESQAVAQQQLRLRSMRALRACLCLAQSLGLELLRLALNFCACPVFECLALFLCTWSVLCRFVGTVVPLGRYRIRCQHTSL